MNFIATRGSRDRWIFYPFLVATYFVLTLAAANPVALQGWWDLLLPFFISVAFSGVCWAAAFLLTRDASRASLLALMWVVAFSLFGYVAEALRPGGVLS